MGNSILKHVSTYQGCTHFTYVDGPSGHRVAVHFLSQEAEAEYDRYRTEEGRREAKALAGCVRRVNSDLPPPYAVLVAARENHRLHLEAVAENGGDTSRLASSLTACRWSIARGHERVPDAECPGYDPQHDRTERLSAKRDATAAAGQVRPTNVAVLHSGVHR
jgi:hypothetical protein